MGQGLSSKDSIPEHQIRYTHRDEYGNVQTFTRTLSHSERYKIHSKADDRGKITMGITELYLNIRVPKLLEKVTRLSEAKAV